MLPLIWEPNNGTEEDNQRRRYWRMIVIDNCGKYFTFDTSIITSRGYILKIWQNLNEDFPQIEEVSQAVNLNNN